MAMIDIDQIIAYENGELDEDEVIELFQELVRTGQAWSLQGSYGRMAQALLDAGLIADEQVNPEWNEHLEGVAK